MYSVLVVPSKLLRVGYALSHTSNKSRIQVKDMANGLKSGARATTGGGRSGSLIVAAARHDKCRRRYMSEVLVSALELQLIAGIKKTEIWRTHTVS